MCEQGSCEECEQTDEIVTFPTEPVHAPALTVHGFTEALRRDGGADPYTRGGRHGW